MTKPRPLITLPIPQLVRNIAIPASVGFFFKTMYNVVDTYFAGTISTQSLAALSLTFPLFFAIIAIPSGFSNAVTALVGNALGADQEILAKKTIWQGFFLGFLLSILLLIMGAYTLTPLLAYLGASQQYLQSAHDYIATIYFGSPFFVANFGLNAILYAQGDTRSFRNILILGFFLNIGLDYYFVSLNLGNGPLGIKGIAYATVIIEFFSSVYLAVKVWQSRLLQPFSWPQARFNPPVFWQIIVQGFPTSANFSLIGLGIFIVTYYISSFGPHVVAGYGAAMRIEQIVLLPTIGLNTATLTLVAQNSGAHLYSRVTETVRVSVKYGGFMTISGALVLLFAGRPLLSIFTTDQSVINAGQSYLQVDAWVLFAYTLIFIYLALLQGLKKPGFGFIVGGYRHLLAPALIFHIIISRLGMDYKTIWWGIFAINWSAALLTYLYGEKVLRRISRTPA